MQCYQDGIDTERCASSWQREPVPQTRRCILHWPGRRTNVVATEANRNERGARMYESGKRHRRPRRGIGTGWYGESKRSSRTVEGAPA